jgi:hypothetical protein
MAYMNINDLEFSSRISIADAYRILEAFIVQYNARGESSTVALMSDIGLVPGGQTADPAQAERLFGMRQKGDRSP